MPNSAPSKVSIFSFKGGEKCSAPKLAKYHDLTWLFISIRDSPSPNISMTWPSICTRDHLQISAWPDHLYLQGIISKYQHDLTIYIYKGPSPIVTRKNIVLYFYTPTPTRSKNNTRKKWKNWDPVKLKTN